MLAAGIAYWQGCSRHTGCVRPQSILYEVGKSMAFWTALVRGILPVGQGATLLFVSGKSPTILGNSVGSSGCSSARLPLLSFASNWSRSIITRYWIFTSAPPRASETFLPVEPIATHGHLAGHRTGAYSYRIPSVIPHVRCPASPAGSGPLRVRKDSRTWATSQHLPSPVVPARRAWPEGRPAGHSRS